jgi:hypothetical protein
LQGAGRDDPTGLVAMSGRNTSSLWRKPWSCIRLRGQG